MLSTYHSSMEEREEEMQILLRCRYHFHWEIKTRFNVSQRSLTTKHGSSKIEIRVFKLNVVCTVLANLIVFLGLYLVPSAAVTKWHKPADSKQQTQILSWWTSFLGSYSFWWTQLFLGFWQHRSNLCLHLHLEFIFMFVSSSYKDTNHVGLRAPLIQYDLISTNHICDDSKEIEF